MAAVGDANEDNRLEEVFKSIFFISKLIGLFPFNIKNWEFRRSLLLILLSLLMIGAWTSYVVKFVDFGEFSRQEHLLKRLTQLLPVFTLFTVFPCHVIWLSLNAKKLAYVLNTARKLNYDVVKTTAPLHVYKKCIFVVLVGELVLEHFMEGHGSYWSFVYLFMILTTFMIADQFSAVLAVLRRYYEHICNNLDLNTAVEFTNSHDLLGKCCRELNECYSPQLLLILISVFVYIVSSMYTLITTYMDTSTADIVQINYLVMFVATILHFLTSCRLTILLSKKFDNLLYRLIINDKSKSLMRNNRILLHYKAMKELEFTAMEFFNFDYSLLCSMVSTATTYIVILVQFSS